MTEQIGVPALCYCKSESYPHWYCPVCDSMIPDDEYLYMDCDTICCACKLKFCYEWSGEDIEKCIKLDDNGRCPHNNEESK